MLPDKEQVSNLRHWAAVVFAARCIRRIAPLANYNAGIVLGTAVFLEKRARSGGPAEETPFAKCADAYMAEAEDTVAFRASETFANAAVEIARIAAASSTPASQAHAHTAMQAAARSVAERTADITEHRNMQDEAEEARNSQALFSSETDRDLRALQQLRDPKMWTDWSPVYTTALGPLWPRGYPSWWWDPEELDRAVDDATDRDWILASGYCISGPAMGGTYLVLFRLLADRGLMASDLDALVEARLADGPCDAIGKQTKAWIATMIGKGTLPERENGIEIQRVIADLIARYQ